MWDYTEKVMDHFRNPRNMGSVEDPDGEGLIGSMACGDALKLAFRLDEDERIQDVGFQTFGCASAIASSSALTEIIKGITLEEAEKVTNKDIADYLGGLPEKKMHCSVIGRDALEAAIDDYRARKSGRAPEKVEKKDAEIVCACFDVSKPEIERAIRDDDLTSVEEVTNYTKAGGGCGCCHDRIEEILDGIASEKRADSPKDRQQG